jgi:hypothetical protein
MNGQILTPQAGQTVLQVTAPMNDVQVLAAVAAQLDGLDAARRLDLAADLLAGAAVMVNSGELSARMSAAVARARQLAREAQGVE